MASLSHTLHEELPPAPEGTDGTWNFHRYLLARSSDILPIDHQIELIPANYQSV